MLVRFLHALSGSQSSAYSRHSGGRGRGFDSTLGHPGGDLASVGARSTESALSQLGGGSGHGSTVAPARDLAT